MVERFLRLLYVCGTYAPGAYAGSELSVHQLLRGVAKRHSVTVLVVTDSRYTSGSPGRTTYEGVPLCGIGHEERESAISQLIDEYQPDAVLTQLLWADVALSMAKNKGVPSILRLVSIPTNLDLSIPAAIVTNAKFSSQWVLEKCGRKADYIASFVDLERVIAPKCDRKPRLITMFNPIKEKGGHIFYGIASAMPKRQFGVVPGWHSLRNKSGHWDTSIMRHSIESQGFSNVDWLPEDIDFSSLANVELLEPREKVAEIYAQTRILIVPSQWDETFARVCIEAYANGIPVIGSAVAGLEEHLKIAGFPIKDKSSVEAWIDAIEALDDQHIFEYYSNLGHLFINDAYDADKICEDFYKLLTRIVTSTKCQAVARNAG